MALHVRLIQRRLMPAHFHLQIYTQHLKEFYPAMEINKIGYGAVIMSKDFANVLKVCSRSSTLIRGEDNVAVLETSIVM